MRVTLIYVLSDNPINADKMTTAMNKQLPKGAVAHVMLIPANNEGTTSQHLVHHLCSKMGIEIVEQLALEAAYPAKPNCEVCEELKDEIVEATTIRRGTMNVCKDCADKLDSEAEAEALRQIKRQKEFFGIEE